MPLLIFQSCTDEDYEKGIVTPWYLNSVQPYVDNPIDIQMLQRQFGDRRMALWVTTPRGKNADWAFWSELSRGDAVFLLRDRSPRSIRHVGLIAAKFVAPRLGNRIWGRAPNRRSYKYLYVLDRDQPTDFPWSEFMPILASRGGFAQKGPRQHFGSQRGFQPQWMIRVPTVDAFITAVVGTRQPASSEAGGATAGQAPLLNLGAQTTPAPSSHETQPKTVRVPPPPRRTPLVHVVRQKVDKYFTRAGRGGGESDTHRALKQAIIDRSEAVVGEKLLLIREDIGLEYQFDTRDRLDVLLIDGFGRYVAVEVEPAIPAGYHVPFLQAGKYRTLVAMVMDVPTDQVRGVVASPAIDLETAQRFEKHGIEAVIMRV